MKIGAGFSGPSFPPACLPGSYLGLFMTMKEYRNLRYWWLHELRQLRAQERSGANVKKAKAEAQRELVKLRKSIK